MDLKKYIKELIQQELDEMSGTGGGEAYSTSFAFSKKRQGANLATKNAEKSGWKLAKKPKTSKVVDYKKIFEMANKLSTGAVGNPNDPQSRSFTPKGFELPKKMFEPVTVQDNERILFKIGTGKDSNEKMLFIDGLARVALDAIERGRTSFEKEQRLPIITKILKDILPSPVRGIIKKATAGIKPLPNGYIPVPVKITREDITGTYGPSTKSIPIQITDRGIQFLKKVKENPNSFKDVLDPGLIQFLISLYKNKDNAKITSGEIANQIGITPILASRYANELAKSNLATLDKSTEPEDSDKWYIYNPGATEKDPGDPEGKTYRPIDSKIAGVGTKLYESLESIIKQELLNEVTYSKFKTEVKFRTKSEQLHKAIREVKKKLSEIDRIVEYTSRMKQELSEGEEGIRYWKATQKNVATISEMINQLNNKIKNLHQ